MFSASLKSPRWQKLDTLSHVGVACFHCLGLRRGIAEQLRFQHGSTDAHAVQCLKSPRISCSRKVFSETIG